MQETINSVVNNFSNRLGEAAEVLTPVANAVIGISETVVYETSTAGMMYSIAGFCCVVCGFLAFLYSVILRQKNAISCGTADALTAVGVVCFMGGLIILLCRLDEWCSPTKAVLKEAISLI